MKAGAAALHFNTVKSFKGLRTWQMCEHVNTRPGWVHLISHHGAAVWSVL